MDRCWYSIVWYSMNKKDRRRLRTLDRDLNLKVGTHEFWVKTTKPEIGNVIIERSKKGNKKDVECNSLNDPL